MPARQILFTESFSKYVGSYTDAQNKEFDCVIRKLCKDPAVGERCCGDLLDVWVYTYKFQAHSYTLAYLFDEKELTFLASDIQVAFEP